MLKQHVRLQTALFLALDLSLVAAAFFLAYGIRSFCSRACCRVSTSSRSIR